MQVVSGCVRAGRRPWAAALVSGVVLLVASACLPPGTVDTAFGGAAGVSLPCASGPDSAMAAAPAGDALVVCSYEVPDTSPQQWGTRLLSFTSAGQPDATFGGDGEIELPLGGTNVDVVGVTRAPDGGVLVAGLEGFSYRLYRYTAQGVLDVGFGAPAQRFQPATVGYVELGSVRSGVMTQAGDLTFLVTQDTATCSGCGTFEGLRVRIFGASGQVGSTITVPLNAFVDPVPAGATEERVVLDPLAVGFDPSYGFLIAGNVFTRYTLGGGTGTVGWDLGVVRLISPGVLDPAYGTAGLSRIDVGYDGSGLPTVGLGQPVAASTAALHTGRVVFGLLPGPASVLALARVGQDGQLDPSFDGDGLASLGTGAGYAIGIATDLFGRTLVGQPGPSAPPTVARIRDDGTPDTAFGSGGSTALPGPAVSFQVQLATPLAASYVLVHGSTAGVSDLRLFRLT